MSRSAGIGGSARRRQRLALLALGVFLLQALGYAPLWRYRQQSARQEMRERIGHNHPDEALTVITFTVAQYRTLHWQQKNAEFWYQHHLYDLVRQTTDAQGHVRLFAEDDSKEKHLFEERAQSGTNRDSQASGHSPGLDWPEFNSPYSMLIKPGTWVRQATGPAYTRYQRRIARFIAEIPSPPPEHA